MTALNRLAARLQDKNNVNLSRLESGTAKLDKLIAQLQKHNKVVGLHVSEDLQRIAIYNFCKEPHFKSLKEARHVSFGLCLPITSEGLSIMEDQQRLQAVLNEHTGIGQWLTEPRKFRRCYQGLIRSYFHNSQNKVSENYKQNWNELRAYLYKHSRNIIDDNKNPEWVGIAIENTALFDKYPCTPYATNVLSGNTEKFDAMCESLGIQKSSWFHRELILEQIRQVTQKEYADFVTYIPRLISLLETHEIHRNKGLQLMLNKYASVTNPALHEILRNAAVQWWGNPWLPSNDSQWGGVEKQARDMVSYWLKSEFVEAFFTKLAEDGLSDTRRAKFWLGYVKHMENVQFALGSTALYSRDPDFIKLREKMKGLYKELAGTTSSNNAFIMTIGNLVVVEFSGMGNACYCYDKRKGIPFGFDRPLEVRVDANNSLKQSKHLIKMSHIDSSGATWEEKISSELNKHLNISLDKSQETSSYNNTTTSKQVESKKSVRALRPKTNTNFSEEKLDALLQEHKLSIRDLRRLAGNLWVLTDDKNLDVNAQLLKFGFHYRANKGWWK